MSTWPRIVTTACWVPDGIHNGGLPPVLIYVKAGTLIDAKPGGPTELMYGASNLSAVIPPWDVRQQSDTRWSKAGLSN